MSGEGEFENSLEFTPTWVMAGVCAVFAAISLIAMKIYSLFIRFLSRNNNNNNNNNRNNHRHNDNDTYQSVLYIALRKIGEELTVLGLISLILYFSENHVVTKICVPPGVFHFHHDMLLPCRLTDRLKAEEADRQAHDRFCSPKNKVPLISVKAVHQIHFFIFLLGVMHIIFTCLVMLLGRARIKFWNKYQEGKHENEYRNAMANKLEYFRQASNDPLFHLKVVGQSILKQFIGSVEESDYMILKYGFCVSYGTFANRKDYFLPHMIRAYDSNFKEIAGISWYLWAFVTIFLSLNVYGWHAFFWIPFILLITLIAFGAILEHSVTQIAVQISDNYNCQNLNILLQPSHMRILRCLIHVILFQNAFEIAIILWIGITYGFDSCMMGSLFYIVPRLLIGIFIQGPGGSTILALNAIVGQMGKEFDQKILDELISRSTIE